MKLDISKEWCLAVAKREGDAEVGAGALARDPAPPEVDLIKSAEWHEQRAARLETDARVHRESARLARELAGGRVAASEQ